MLDAQCFRKQQPAAALSTTQVPDQGDEGMNHAPIHCTGTAEQGYGNNQPCGREIRGSKPYRLLLIPTD